MTRSRGLIFSPLELYKILRKIMKKVLWLLALLNLILPSCGNENSGVVNAQAVEETTQIKVARGVAEQLWTTSPLQYPFDKNRISVFEEIQNMADACSADFFTSYLTCSDKAAEMREKYEPILAFYRLSFEHVLQAIKEDHVEKGTACIWNLYNMGYIVKTPSTCFGIDINHRWAWKLEPYLDFLCITHNHRDHQDAALIEAMLKAQKPVFSNFIEKGNMSKVPTDYQVKNVKVHVSITDHNNSGMLNNFVSVFTFECGEDSGNFTLLHTGDSNFKPEQYTNILPRVNVLVTRYAPNALTENNILGEGKGKTQPDYVLVSHLLELMHIDEADCRWSLKSGLIRAANLNCKKAIVPMWGEKLIWKNNKLN